MEISESGNSIARKGHHIIIWEPKVWNNFIVQQWAMAKEIMGVQPLKWKTGHFFVAAFISWFFFSVPKEQATES